MYPSRGGIGEKILTLGKRQDQMPLEFPSRWCFLGLPSWVQWLRLCAPNAGDLGVISAQGTGSHMLQVGVCMPQLKIACAATKEIHTDFPGGPVVRNPLANAGDTGSIPGPGRFDMPWGN